MVGMGKRSAALLRALVLHAAVALGLAPGFIVLRAEEPHSHGEAMTPASPPTETATLGGVVIADGFVRATLPRARVGAGYLSITNSGPAPDRLLGARSEASQEVQLHASRLEGDIMTMTPLPEGIVIGPGETIRLEPGGMHIMFIGPKAPFVEGETVPVTLIFEMAGEIALSLPVAAAGAPALHAH